MAAMRKSWTAKWRQRARFKIPPGRLVCPPAGGIGALCCELIELLLIARGMRHMDHRHLLGVVQILDGDLMLKWDG